METWTVLVVDDHAMMGEGIEDAVQQHRRFRVIGRAASGREALEKMRGLGPVDAVITDLEMPGMNGLEFTELLRKRYPDTRVLVVTAHGHLLESARHAGANGLVKKESGRGELLNGLQAILEHPEKFYLDSSVIARPATPASFTTRELQVICLTLEDMKGPDIAKKLKITTVNYDNLMRSIRRKMGVSGIAGVVRYAYEHKLCEKT